MINNELFKGRTLLIVTKHGKEKVLSHILEKELGVKCLVTKEIDTDVLGTFTGEIERKNDALTTARLKCEMAMQHYNCDLAIASEGSFGPHPNSVFLAANVELLLFLDTKNNLEIVASAISSETNFGAADITSENELIEFVEKSGFPLHGFFLRPSKTDFSSVSNTMMLGIQNSREVLKIYRNLMQTHGKVYIETDMRAMHNPTRMKVIAAALEKLIEKIKSECAECGTPGFSVTEVKAGLPCEWCGRPTNSPLSAIYVCKKCAFQKETFFPQNKKTEDPMYCDNCNP